MISGVKCTNCFLYLYTQSQKRGVKNFYCRSKKNLTHLHRVRIIHLHEALPGTTRAQKKGRS